MPMESQLPKRNRVKSAVAAAALLLTMAGAAAAEEPIKIGLGMSLTGPLAANGKMSLVPCRSGNPTSTHKVACSGGR